MNIAKEDFGVHCDGCGRMVHESDVVLRDEPWDPNAEICAFCKNAPLEREAYVRGFNRGMDMLAEAMTDAAKTSGLRRTLRPGICEECGIESCGQRHD
jgi:hypothetical protein